MLQLTIRVSLVIVAGLMLAACGDSPLRSVGERSSEWINEPKVVTTTAPVVTVPETVGSTTLQGPNDEIVTENLGDPGALVAEVFSRREGDRFIQASRAEIAAALPGLQFPTVVPYGAEWVSSQLVIENNGRLSDDPSAAFGIWSAEPYTRSRSVAQMAVLAVSEDAATAAELAAGEADASCARFSDVSTNECQITEAGGRRVWALTSSSGTTLVWFDGDYRYELFGRTFVEATTLLDMARTQVALSELAPISS